MSKIRSKMEPPLNVVFIGCVEVSRELLKATLRIPEVEVRGVITRSASSINADFHSLKDLAAEHNVPCILAEGNKQGRLASFIQENNADCVFCFGWSYLLKPEVLTAAPMGVIGYHPAALPRNRGRHPLIWALALDLNESGSSFFVMDEEADSGPIVDQRIFQIQPNDDATDLYRKMIENATAQVADFAPRLARGDIIPKPQDASLANNWRKRGMPDGEIDFRMSTRAISCLVRALTRPYVGAHFMHHSMPFTVWACREADWPERNIEPGKVLKRDGASLLVKTFDGAVWLNEHTCAHPPEPGEYL